MSAADLLDLASDITLVVFSLALLLTAWRIAVGPTLPDRVVALDLLIGVVIGLIATVSIKTGYHSYLDIAIALGLVGFLATVAFARFVLSRGQSGDAPATLPDVDQAPASGEIVGGPAAGRPAGAATRDPSTGRTGHPS